MIVKKVNAFTESISGGNPAGVVLHPPPLTDDQMKYISRLLSVSETAYVFPSTQADYKVRFFSPNIEVNLCGHATIATFFTMAQDGIFPQDKNSITQETKAGILPITIYISHGECEKVMMTQSKPFFKNMPLNFNEIAQSLGIKQHEIDKSLPSQIVSTGLFTLPICVKSFAILKKIHPNSEHIKNLCKQLNCGSFHVFTFETIDPSSIYHARNFAPCYGINEDPVTGTANGSVTSYLIQHGIIKKKKLVCEQGDIIGRPGRVIVEINGDSVQVGGKAIVVEEIELNIE